MSDKHINDRLTKKHKNSKLKSIIACFAGLLVVAVMVTALLLLTYDKGKQLIPNRRGNYSITAMVSVSEDCGYEVESENPVRLASGDDAIFKIRICDGFKKTEDQPDNIIYNSDDGTLTIKNVRYPTEITFGVRPLETYTFELKNDEKNCLIETSVTDGKITEDSLIKVTVKKITGKSFMGFSVGGKVADGGTMVSYSPEYEFRAKENVVLYANYATEGAQLIIYDANGGTVTGSKSTSMAVENLDKNYICPNTLQDKDYLKRDGYILYGYNTEADGSGKYYGLGWNIPIPESGVLKLYAMWAKETDASQFRYKKNTDTNTVTITKYLGNEETVTVPQYIEGLPVTEIGANAFLMKKFKTLILGKHIGTISANAVSKCSSFTTLYMPDMITNMTDISFSDCGSFSTLYINAVTDPRYTAGRNGTYQIKFERLITAPSPKLVIVAGSSSAYGIDSARLEKNLSGKYNVVNYGTNQGTPAAFYIEVASHFMGEGDILLDAPEPHKYQWGYNEINTTTWQIFEAAYDAFSYVDIRNYTKIFTSFAAFNRTRQSMTPRKYTDYTSETVNQYGDYIKYKPNRNADTIYPSPDKAKPNLNFSTSFFTDANVKCMNRSYSLVKEAGAKVYISFAPTNKHAIVENSTKRTTQLTYMNTIKEKYNGTVISDVADYIMKGNYFYNSNLHLSTEGSQIRTDKLASDILTQLSKEGIK